MASQKKARIGKTIALYTMIGECTLDGNKCYYPREKVEEMLAKAQELLKADGIVDGNA